jgi:opacity protein-like surface antigen
MLPVAGGNTALVYLLVGPAVSYSSWQVTVGGQGQSLTELAAGLSLGAGLGVRAWKVAARLDYKYVIEDRTQKGFVFSAQFEF